MKSQLRKFFRWTHVWLGLVGGTFICLMGFTGGMVALRPQLAMWMAPSVPAVANCSAPDWERASREVTSVTHSEINRVYGPAGADTRYHFRMATARPIIYEHVIYDMCSARVLASVNLAWMDWTVDLHHNLLNGKTGRLWTGWIGLLMLVSGLSGLMVWLLARPELRTAFRVRLRWSRGTPRELHRAFGLVAACLLVIEAFTGLWLAFPQTMRSVAAIAGPVEENVRPAKSGKSKKTAARTGLADWIGAAERAVPGGFVREVRMPESNGYAQIRMWLPGDFRSLGNNVVFVSSSDARVLAVDRYADRSGPNRFIQAMAGLHYDEWGGFAFRMIAAVAGLVTPLLFVTGLLLWWFSRRRRAAPVGATRVVEEAVLSR